MKAITALSLALAVSLLLVAPLQAEEKSGWQQFTSGVKEAGKEIGQTGKEIGQEAGKVGKAVGKEAGETGKEAGLGIADGFKKAGRAIKEFFTGSDSSEKGSAD